MTKLNSPEPSNQVSDAMIEAARKAYRNSPFTLPSKEAFALIYEAMTQAKPEQQSDVVERVANAIEAARCVGREGPFGGYDYGHNPDFYGPPPEAGRYVIRDFRDPASPDWGKWLHQTDDKADHEALFEKMTREHYAIAALAALNREARSIPVDEGVVEHRKELRSVLADCSEFLADIDGTLADRCEAMLSQVVADDHDASLRVS